MPVIRLRRVTDLLLEPPGDLRSLHDWVRLAGASARTLGRLFEAELGTSFTHYRRQVQMHAAVALLAADIPVRQVELELGYATPSAFTFAFRTVMGLPPSAFLAK